MVLLLIHGMDGLTAGRLSSNIRMPVNDLSYLASRLESGMPPKEIQAEPLFYVPPYRPLSEGLIFFSCFHLNY
jgi:hypothetical protein